MWGDYPAWAGGPEKGTLRDTYLIYYRKERKSRAGGGLLLSDPAFSMLEHNAGDRMESGAMIQYCFIWQGKKKPRDRPLAPDRPQYCAGNGSWEESQIVYADVAALLQLLLPVTAETIIIHPDERIFFSQCDDGALQPIEFCFRKYTPHNEQKTIKVGIIKLTAAVFHQKSLFRLVEGRLLLKETVIYPASMCA